MRVLGGFIWQRTEWARRIFGPKRDEIMGE
jgi:hypothetical protein